MPASYYEVLGVPPTATDAELKRAFVALARRHHPDFHESADPRVRAANERAMQAVNEAWTVLGDRSRRDAYDADRRLRSDRTRDSWDRWEAGASAAAADAARKAWRPLDDRDDDPDDPAAEHDRPITPVLVPRLLTLTPILLSVGGFALVVFGLFVSVLSIAAVGFAAVLASLPLYLAAPFYTLAKSKDDGSWGPKTKR